MIPRRVVTNINTVGKAILQSDGVPPWSKEMVHTPGFASSFIWATSPAPKIPTSGDDPTDTATSIVPGPGETRFLVVTFPPDSVFADPAVNTNDNVLPARGRNLDWRVRMSSPASIFGRSISIWPPSGGFRARNVWRSRSLIARHRRT